MKIKKIKMNKYIYLFFLTNLLKQLLYYLNKFPLYLNFYNYFFQYFVFFIFRVNIKSKSMFTLFNKILSTFYAK